MKKDYIIHFTYMVALFITASLLKGWFDFAYISFWVGGILGTFFPDIDHLVYVYVLKPKESTSLQVGSLISQGKVKDSLGLLAKTMDERKELILHTAYFQAMFVVFAFLIITSSGSLFGTGLVLAFALHLFIDQLIDYMQKGDYKEWFDKIPIDLDKKQRVWYLVGNAFLILLFALYF